MEEKTEETAPKKTAKMSRVMFEYTSFLSAFPAPGGGGAHVGFYRMGILGYKAGILEEQIVADIKKALSKLIKDGKAGRVPTDNEVKNSVHDGFVRALEEATGIRPAVTKKPAPKLPENTFSRIALANKGVTADDIAKKSPVPLDFPLRDAAWRTVEALYLPDDMLYIGEFKARAEVGDNIRPAGEWVEILKKSTVEYPYIIPNPLSGEGALKKDGSGMTLRGDGNVVKFRHMVAEMDNDTLEDQLAFWSFVELPLRALTYSGGKSLHAWVDVDCDNRLEWELEIENDLFPNYMVPLRCDVSCKNESRVSRLPGHVRRPDEKNPGTMQQLLWLSPEGKAVCE